MEFSAQQSQKVEVPPQGSHDWLYNIYTEPVGAARKNPAQMKEAHLP